MLNRWRRTPTVGPIATSASRGGRNALALVVLTCGYLMIGVTPSLGEAIAKVSDSYSGCESIGLAVCASTAQQRAGAHDWTVRLATRGLNTARDGRRITAAPTHGHRLANGQMAPMRC